ncbi:DUF6233 domain-containing protein [Streptomyces griseosporeus]
MPDLPPVERLAKLRALEEWLDWQLNSTRARIRTTEAEVERLKRAEARAYAEQRWKVEPARSGQTVLHRGGCGVWKQEAGYLERREVFLLLEDDTLTVKMCDVCQPETGLRG